MRKEDLRLFAGFNTNMIVNMGKGKHISMETPAKTFETLDCDISDVVQLEHEENVLIPQAITELVTLN